MATIKTSYTILSCKKCGTQLYKAASGSQTIGNPILSCRWCKISARNPMRDEWYNYRHKTSAILLPCLMPVLTGVLMPIVMVVMMQAEMKFGAMALVGFILGAIIGLGLGISNFIAIIKSKKRMKNPEHLMNLMLLNIISQREYQELMKQAKQPQ